MPFWRVKSWARRGLVEPVARRSDGARLFAVSDMVAVRTDMRWHRRLQPATRQYLANVDSP